MKLQLISQLTLYFFKYNFQLLPSFNHYYSRPHTINCKFDFNINLKIIDILILILINFFLYHLHLKLIIVT